MGLPCREAHVPTTVLADRLVQELTACRAASGDHYPIRLDHLAARLDPPPEPTAVLKVAGSKAFAAKVIAAVKGRPDAPVALLEDASALAASPLTLEVTLRAKGEKGAPPWPPKQLAKAVQKSLQPAFQTNLDRQIETSELPSFAVRVGSGNKVGLHHRDVPPPPPPPPPEVQDAERLLDLLRRGDRAGVTLVELQSEAGLEPTAFKTAAKQPVFVAAAMQVKVKPNDVYVVPNGDGFGQFVTGTLLARLLAGCSRTSAHAFPVKELVALVSDKTQQQVVAGLLEPLGPLVHDLPAGIGCVLLSGGKSGSQNVFFSLEHLRARTADGATDCRTRHNQPTADFATAFDAAFARIDRERGSNNFVSLVDLRARSPARSAQVRGVRRRAA